MNPATSPEAQARFEALAAHFGVKPSKVFGHPSLKAEKKAFATLCGTELVVKLAGSVHAEALALAGASLFDPSGEGKPMKEWVQIPFDHADQWERYAQASLSYVMAAASVSNRQ